MIEPASLHPEIDLQTCTGCAACVRACPEEPFHSVLGIVQGKARLVGPAHCIGHGACKVACPVGAIQLVLANARRGVNIPVASPAFESSLPGIFIAGELGGMGLIRNALEQGRQAVESVASRARHRAGHLDLVIIGAGPAGFAASLAATQRRLNFVTLEQDSLGGCVFQYPRSKLVMTSSADLPLLGKIQLGNTSKEQLLEFWREAERRTGLKIRYRERVCNVQSRGDTFIVTTQRQSYLTTSVLLAVGRRGSPRKLSIPGEDLPKVVYRLIEPEQYCGQSVVVVGGGDSALEAAASIAEQTHTEVLLSYRGDLFDRAKPANRLRVEAARRTGRLEVLLRSTVTSIDANSICIDLKGRVIKTRNDAVIICAGGVPVTAFLRKIGLDVGAR